MSLQDDHFDLEAYFKQQLEKTKKNSHDRTVVMEMQAKYQRVWDAFVEIENDVEKMQPVVAAVSTLVRYVVDTHYTE